MTAAASNPPVDADGLGALFVRLCEIASPTGSERAVADAVLAELRGLGIDVVEDDRAEVAEAGSGNLIARIPAAVAPTFGDDEPQRWIAFFCHLDTVPEPNPIEVELRDGIYRSVGETILGADNKAAVAVLIELARRAVTGQVPAPLGIELVFTVAEEQGLRGAATLDLDLLRSRHGYVLDHASPIGEVITAAPTYNRVIATFRGVEAHSGIRPEAGNSAIEAAAQAIGGMRLGRLDDETTANIGVIAGGTASNVVPGRCRLEGEARSIDPAKATGTTEALVDACTFAATECGCDLDVEVIEMFRGYRLRSSSDAVKAAKLGLQRCGIEPSEVATGGGSDANALMVRGFETILLANGTTDNHTPQEAVSAAALTKMVEVCEAIAVATAEDPPSQ